MQKYRDQPRFHTLDGLRGVAAILVVFYHMRGAAPIAAPAGYLAVDVFFALSGFVLSRAYDTRFRAGLGLGEFAALRLIRVYPTAFLGAAIGVVLAGDFYLSLLLVPNLQGIGGPSPLYPANIPLWSLLLELAVNLVFAVVATRAGWRWLIAILLASAAIVAGGTGWHPLAELGGFWPTAGLGLFRTVFSFAIGVGMQRLHVCFALRRRETHLAWLLPAALIVLATQLPPNHRIADLVSLFVLLPAILWLGTIWEAPGAGLMRELGALSYPLYCIHEPMLDACERSGIPAAYVWLPLLGAAWWLDRSVDAPLRRWLLRQRQVPGRQSALAAPTDPPCRSQ